VSATEERAEMEELLLAPETWEKSESSTATASSSSMTDARCSAAHDCSSSNEAGRWTLRGQNGTTYVKCLEESSM